MVERKQFYTAPSVVIFTRVRNMSLLNSLSADLVFEDMEDGGDVQGSPI